MFGRLKNWLFPPGWKAKLRRAAQILGMLALAGILFLSAVLGTRTGREAELELGRAPASKRVVVIGGGPGGLEAARVAARRGHRVALYERRRFLGGALLVAATVHPENQPFLDYLVREVHRLGVDVHLGMELDAQRVGALRADAVIVASGGRLEGAAVLLTDGEEAG